MLKEFGWTRAITSGAFSLASIISGVLAIAMGGLTDKFGPRIVMTLCGLLLGIGSLLISQISALWQLYLLYGILVGTGMSAADIPVVATVARWFIKRRGMMTGITKVGAGIGIMVVPLLASWLISSYGWRNTYIILGMGFIVLLIAAARVMRHNPHEMGLMPDNESYEPSIIDTGSGDPAMPLKEIVKTKQFWAINLAEFCTFFCLLPLQSVSFYLFVERSQGYFKPFGCFLSLSLAQFKCSLNGIPLCFP